MEEILLAVTVQLVIALIDLTIQVVRQKLAGRALERAGAAVG